MSWQALAGGIRWQVEPWIEGRRQASSAADRFDTINPATETALCRVSIGSAGDVDLAVQVARKRFEDGSWSEQPPNQRAAILLKLADLLVRHKEELALLDALEMGKPIKAALYDAGTFAPGLLRTYATCTDQLRGEMTAFNQTGPMVFNTYEPRGVVAAITPWNYPLVCAVLKAGPALAAGNTVVLKPSEISPSSALRFAELAQEAGVPEGVLNVVPGLGRTVGAALALHREVDMLSFTGSTATGRRIMQLAGQSNGKPLLLECGGKSAQLVFNDVENLDVAADAAAQNITANQGQVCAACTRLLVQDSIADAFIEKVVARASRCEWGDPLEESTTFGPLASPAQRDRVKGYVEQGVAAGAHAALLGKIQDSGGCYVSPTIFDRVDSSMSIVREEIFGPVLCVQRFSTEAEAIALANESEYGLAATAWTSNLGRGRRLAHALRAGGVSIRTSGTEGPASGSVVGYEPRKASGFGAERGLKGLQSYSTLKLVQFLGA